MTRTQRYTNIGAVVVPFVAFLAAIVLLWNRAVGWTDLAIIAAMYLVTAIGITIGFHRLLTHRSFQTHKPIEYAFAIAGSMAVQGPVIDWVADHRKHHAHTDEEGDPHSPHVGHGSGLAGLWHAHVGWLFDANGQADRRKYAPDLMEDRGMRPLNRHFLWLVGALAGAPVRRSASRSPAPLGGLTALLWGGLVRIFFVHHITWSINSICHFLGRRRFDDRRPVDQRLVARAALARRGLAPQPPRLPRARPFHGLRWWELDLVRPDHPRDAAASASPGTSSRSRRSARQQKTGLEREWRTWREVFSRRDGHLDSHRHLRELPDPRRARLRRRSASRSGDGARRGVRARRRDRLLRHGRAGVRRGRAGALAMFEERSAIWPQGSRKDPEDYPWRVDAEPVAILDAG